ncbi:hypothetical protein G6F57_005405 [Rhizopus arrhizus]|nr:hypothetical protein G6F30_006508 [Rhizopus arrhizus]KAG1412457.1 hypothetical protein G6F58_008001 [Rhizopus delemar]KAG1023398.1 hypothetical protein G6F26_006842 [Rhizopus arrhizus]KAG1038272.1 hypothetical protein G6F25_006523 [Rhizopus arrhizus]KAG1068851.1 hypothetical protein G6F41_006503 [Rhizopus arrhizus]
MLNSFNNGFNELMTKPPQLDWTAPTNTQINVPKPVLNPVNKEIALRKRSDSLSSDNSLTSQSTVTQYAKYGMTPVIYPSESSSSSSRPLSRLSNYSASSLASSSGIPHHPRPNGTGIPTPSRSYTSKKETRVPTTNNNTARTQLAKRASHIPAPTSHHHSPPVPQKTLSSSSSPSAPTTTRKSRIPNQRASHIPTIGRPASPQTASRVSIRSPTPRLFQKTEEKKRILSPPTTTTTTSRPSGLRPPNSSGNARNYQSNMGASPIVTTPFLDENIDTPYSPPFFDTFDLPSYANALNQEILVGNYLNDWHEHGAIAQFNGDPTELLIDKSKTPQLSVSKFSFTPAQKSDHEGLFPPLQSSKNTIDIKPEPVEDEFRDLLDLGSPLSEEMEPLEEEQEQEEQEAVKEEKPVKEESSLKENILVDENPMEEKPKKRGRKRKQQDDEEKPPKKRPSAKKSPGSRLYPCPYCDHVSKRRYNLSTHIKTHDKNRTKEFECPQCLKRFDRRHDRDRHLATVHRGERSFTCKECSVHFSRRDGLNRHLASQHEDNDDYD